MPGSPTVLAGRAELSKPEILTSDVSNVEQCLPVRGWQTSRPTDPKKRSLTVRFAQFRSQIRKGQRSCMDIFGSVNICLIPVCRNLGTHPAPGGSAAQRLCCKHFDQFIAHLMNPDHNPTFPEEASDGPSYKMW
jgi:hypothetical protein